MWFSLSLITSQSKLSLNSEANAADQWKDPFLVPPLTLDVTTPKKKRKKKGQNKKLPTYFLKKQQNSHFSFCKENRGEMCLKIIEFVKFWWKKRVPSTFPWTLGQIESEAIGTRRRRRKRMKAATCVARNEATLLQGERAHNVEKKLKRGFSPRPLSIFSGRRKAWWQEREGEN